VIGVAGTRALIRLALRRDRVLLPVWVVVMVGMTAATSSAGRDLFTTVTSRIDAAAAINGSPSFVAMLGRIYDPTSLGNTSLIKLTTFGAATLGVVASMLVVRHTRREEENGRLELLGAAVVGRQAALAAALIVTLGTMLVIGALTSLALVATGLPTGGAWAFGMAWAATGMTFAAIAAVAAQLTMSARSANAIALGSLGLFYALRAIGDTVGTADEPAIWSWLSPIGWGQQVRAFAGDRVGVLGYPIGATVVILAVAFVLASRRDLGAGLLPDRAGAPMAPPSLTTPLGLAWRLQRGPFLGWVVGYLMLGFLTGNLAASVGSFASTDQLRDLIRRLGGTQVLTDAFVAYMFGFTACLTAAYSITVALRLRAEEESGLAEQMLATSVHRRTWLASHVTIAVGGATVLSLVAGLSAGIANAMRTGVGSDVAGAVAASVVYLPAIWVITGLAVALFGYLPRASSSAWGVLVAIFLLDELGALLGLPVWARDLSPFAHIPRLPGNAMTWTPLVILTALALGLLAAGVLRFRRRDLTTA